MLLSNKSLRVGLDLDGVISNFTEPYEDELNKIQRSSLPYIAPRSWHFESDAGFTTETVETFWATTAQGEEFWRSLPLACTENDLEHIRRIAYKNTVYFISKRPLHLLTVTKAWIEKRVFSTFDSPAKTYHWAVALSNDKGYMAKGLGLHYMIDDKPANLEHVLEVGVPGCKCVLYDQPWNKNHVNPHIERVYEFREIVDRIEGKVV